MATKLTGREAKQGDRGWTLARALLIALIVGGAVLIALELYGTYVQPQEPELDVPAQTTVPETNGDNPPASATPDQSDQTQSGEPAPSAQ
jgi:hypothetical protein